MQQRRWGRIINISSGAARGAGAVGAHYNASKAGMEGLTRGYAARLAKDNVLVNAVAPSLIATEMIAPHRKENESNIPVGRLGTGEEVAAVVVTVAQNPYMTGQTVGSTAVFTSTENRAQDSRAAPNRGSADQTRKRRAVRVLHHPRIGLEPGEMIRGSRRRKSCTD